MAEMDRNLQVETLLQEIEMLRFENEELKKQRNMDRLQMQSDWQRDMEGSSLQPTHQLENTVQFPVQVKKELDHESSPCRTPSAKVNPSEDMLINWLDDKTATTRQMKDGRTMLVKAATYDGSSSWLDYKAHFETCAEINNWTNNEKGLYLAVALRGQAQSVMGNLSDKSKDYDSLVKALEDRFAPPNQTELYRVQLRERRQKASESLSELGQDIRRLTNLAYPTATTELRETLAKDQFIDSLISVDMRLRIKQARPTSLNEAVRHAVELEAFNRAEKSKLESQGILNAATTSSPTQEQKATQGADELQQLKSAVERLGKELEKIIRENKYRYRQPRPVNTKQETNARWEKRCFECGSKFHLRSNCPKLKSWNVVKRKAEVSKSEKDSSKKAPATANSLGPGLYVHVNFGGQILNSLVDTGASLTVMSTRVWESSNLSKHGMLPEYNRTVVTASGAALEVKGKTTVSLQIGEESYDADVIVADVENDLLIGLDFMRRHGCTVDVENNVLIIQGKKCDLNCRGSIGCHRVVAKEDEIIPARSERIITGRVVNMTKATNDLYIVEPDNALRKDDRGLVARALVQGSEYVPLRLMNVTDEPQIIRKSTNIATLSPVCEVKRHCIRPAKQENVPEHLKDLYERTVVGMTKEQKAEIAKLLKKYSNSFSKSDEDVGRTGIVRHKINTENAHPIKQPLRRTPVHLNSEIDKQIDDMLQRDVIQPSSSPWASGIVIVSKKDGTKRFCVDYRKLNDVTVKDSYPIPRIDDSLEQLSGAQWFSCLDLNAGYWQVEVDEADREKTAFTSRRGLFEFKTMPFGLCNAPATFERLMETVLAGLNWQICLIYLDDIIVHGESFEAMLTNLDRVLSKLQEAGLKLKPRKCQLFKKEVEYLGHIVSASGIKTDPKKIQAVRDWPEPNNVTELRSFIGLCSYYRRFILGFANIAKPLHRLTSKGEPFVWTCECSQAFEKLKNCLCEAPTLAHPDFTKEFILDTDASDFAIGAVLSQVFDGKERVIAYASKTLTKAERRYCVTRKELYALVHFVKYFRHYLYGKKFTIRTDHGSLRWLMQYKNPEGQVARWLEILSSFNMKIIHRPGRSHRNADGMSRIRCKQCGMYSEVQAEDSAEKVAMHNQIAQVTEDQVIDLKSAQDQDKDISKIRHWVESNEKPDRKEKESESYFQKSLLSQWERLAVKNGVLMRRWDILDTNEVYWQGIIPLSHRRIVLKYSHDIKASGHLGIKKTLSKIRQSYYWPGLQNDVKAYVGGCDICSRRKEPLKTKRAPMEIVKSGFPMERIAIDILGELPITERGNRYILVIGDYFSKWTECHAMPNMEASTVASILVEQVVLRFGIPYFIHSDQGRQFESKLFSEMCKLLQITKTRTTPYHPKSDGMVERFNKTLTAMLSAFVNENHTNWDEQLQYVMMAYRSTEHETTGLTPNMCMLGRETTCPLDIMYEMPPAIKSIPQNMWVWQLQENLEMAHAKVRQNISDNMKRQKRYHDENLSFETFEAGDKVYVYFPVKKVGCSSKLTSYWRGPYQIFDKLSNSLYKVNCGREGQVQVIHCDRLRKAKQQVLAREDNIVEEDEGLSEPLPSMHNGGYEVDFSKEKRVRRKPEWMKDYILSAEDRSEAEVNEAKRISKRPIPAKRKTVPKTGAVKESYDMTAKEEMEEGRVNNGTMTEMSKPDEFDNDDVDEMTVVMKPCFREILRFKIPSVGLIKFGTKM